MKKKKKRDFILAWLYSTSKKQEKEKKEKEKLNSDPLINQWKKITEINKREKELERVGGISEHQKYKKKKKKDSVITHWGFLMDL